MKRTVIAISLVAAITAAYFGLKQYRSHADCKQRQARLARQIESIRHDAQEQLKVGTKKLDVISFFEGHNIPLAMRGSEASGTLLTFGCAPFGCGTDDALIGVRVELDELGTVKQEPKVVNLYTDCL